MAAVTDRTSFKEYCLSRLGSPVINIEVADSQVEDRIDDAIQLYLDYHYDGTEKQYYRYQIQQADIDNKYITLPGNIIGIQDIFPLGTWTAMNSIFSFQYQYALNNIFDLTSSELAPYYMSMQYLQFMEQILVGRQPVRFNRKVHQLHIDMDWSRVSVGYWLIVECYQVVDPDTYTDMWNDRWLKKYATALIKKQWGDHLVKFKGGTLPGGMQFDGEGILSSAEAEVAKAEQELMEMYSGILEFFEG